MSTQITSNILRGCKDNVGGISKLYLFTYTKYSRSQIVYSGLTLTSFPATDIYEFDLDNKPNFQNKTEEEDGGKYFSESLDLSFVGFNVWDGFEDFLNKDLRAIIKDNNGNFRLLGAFNGLQVKNLKWTTGGLKNEFRGYNFTLEGKELKQSLFISDLSAAGFTVQDNNFLQLENGDYLLTEDNKLIIIE